MPNCLSPNPKTEQRKAMLYIPWINAGIQQRNQKHNGSRNCNVTFTYKYETSFQKYKYYGCVQKQIKPKKPCSKNKNINRK